ncbi:MFS transporter [Rhizobiales bacterium RZME27]|uniref:MFS transporter n=1 Tax=Endobacterium cereale TaxID=2663029 RepID=A0A6A8A405_9HYPH|nr:MFS transporter [Endobacterium cereale]
MHRRSHSFARMHKVSAISWLPIPALVGPIVGPPIGGVLVTDLDWRWIFYIICSDRNGRNSRCLAPCSEFQRC